MKRILITSTDVMMYLFLLPHVKYLVDNGYHVDVACSCAQEFKFEAYDEYLRNNLPAGSSFFHLSSERSPFSFANIKGFQELSEIIKEGDYDLVWTNEPVMGVITRLAASRYRKKGLKVMYLAHGYHFFKGAPLTYWLYYPIEKYFARYCDMMVMINWDDFHLTQKKFRRPVKHIDGIGLDIGKFKDVSVDYNSKRCELDVGIDDLLILSVGELRISKNHESMIRAIARVKDTKITYIICGVGERLGYLKKLSIKLKVDKTVRFLGLRYDIGEILKVSDIFAHPSRREGLGVASLEAMAAGLPLITSNTRGIKDYSVNGKTGYSIDTNDVDGYTLAIQKLASSPDLRNKMGIGNMKAVEKYSLHKSTSNLKEIVKELIG